MLGFVIAVLTCSGSNCTIIQPEPAVSYPSYDACFAAIESKSDALNAFAAQHPIAGRSGNIVCLQSVQTITEVEDRYDVVETAIVRAGPSDMAESGGVVEAGQRLVVTGEVAGTPWLRVVLRDGRTGFVDGERLRRVGGARLPVVAMAPNPPPPPPPPPPQRDAVVTPPPPPQQDAAVTPPPPPSTPAKPPAADAPPAPLAAGEFRACEHCPVMVTVEAGGFAMGSSDDPTEKPIHRVSLKAFGIGKFPVSVAEWNACAAAGGCAYHPPAGEGDPARMPVTNVSWTDASEYVAWLQKITGKPYRLASESEWEFAARAGTKTRFWWGEQAGTGHADCEGCGEPHESAHPQPSDAFPPNPWGLYAMAGGVAEWVDDCWHLSYQTFQGAPTDGSPWRLTGCTRHVLRGGSWRSPPAQITVSTRNFYDTNVRYVANGLRVAVSLP